MCSEVWGLNESQIESIGHVEKLTDFQFGYENRVIQLEDYIPLDMCALIERSKTLPLGLPQVRHILKQLLEGIEALNDLGFYHGDLAYNNVLFKRIISPLKTPYERRQVNGQNTSISGSQVFYEVRIIDWSSVAIGLGNDGWFSAHLGMTGPQYDLFCVFYNCYRLYTGQRPDEGIDWLGQLGHTTCAPNFPEYMDEEMKNVFKWAFLPDIASRKSVGDWLYKYSSARDENGPRPVPPPPE